MKKSVCFLLLLFLMLVNPDCVTDGAKSGLLLWYSSVVPALFPFMVISALVTSGGGTDALMKPASLLLAPLFGLSPSGCCVLLLGLFCGYPMGAKTCADFLKAKRISMAETRLLMAISNHPSPMFLFGYAYALLKPQTAAWPVLAAVYLPILPIGLLARVLYRPKKAGNLLPPDNEKHAPVSSDEAILSSVTVLCKIGGYLMLFSVLIAFLEETSVLPESLKIVLAACLEMTTGVRQCAVKLPFPLSGAAVCAALTFGGFSGLFQTRSVLGEASGQGVSLDEKKTGLRIRSYFLWKLLHALMSFWLFLFFSR